MLSNRARALLQSEPFLVKAHFDCTKNNFDQKSNPGGYVNFGTAENYLIAPDLLSKLNEAHCQDLHVLNYDHLFGASAVRAQVAKFLERSSEHRVIDPDSIVLSSGSSAIIENLIYTLCEPGDGVLIPTPYYPGFDFDLTARVGVIPVPIPQPSQDGFKLSVGTLESTYLKSINAGISPRVLLITSPNNPLGQVYSRELLNDLVDFCNARSIDCIFDEVYAHSCFLDRQFASSLVYRSERIHTIYSFAKDFGLSGLKIGVYHSTNSDVIEAMRSLSYFSPVSTHTQYLVAEMLRDENWVTDLLSLSKRRLAAAHKFTTERLLAYGIKHSETDAGLFVFIDLRPCLESNTFEAETKLWSDLFYKTRINISPGSAFHCSEPGFFRICFAHPFEILSEGLSRLIQHLSLHKNVVERASRQAENNDPITGEAFFYPSDTSTETICVAPTWQVTAVTAR
jgi:aspartate/methionine/tyrosine aminotransferase